MPRPVNQRRFRLPAAHRRARADLRTSDLVLAVTVVAILGVVCLMLAGSLIGTTDDMATGPTSAQSS
ncbi:hypothetical protein DA075_22070 [Methylobacterium currus]|jgi:hypothetical protein|uniref:Uncharacterized protein n=1 Tax=Methylobacterium currus TaxID=2051553 RepID=A0A2R4WNW7_9HYPH|nr:hypothetical protein [Methylobacterium currus]AWB23254.1 hypothetical protein DA075_22070 [Methylobacterium currus]UHC17298.1 hypothetical protein LRS73_05230 [Methylobacterium currus]